MGNVHLGALLRYMYVARTGLRFHEEQKVTRAVAFVFVIKALRLPGLYGEGLSRFFDQFSVAERLT